MKYLDNGSVVVMTVTLVLFVVALFVKGLTKDLLLEAGVFLVSIKLMIMAYKNGRQQTQAQKSLDEILRRLPAEK